MPSLTLHASCVSLAGRGLLIRGKSGSGKSSLALQLMAYGADLVADDQVHLWPEGEAIRARSPEALKGFIEARHFGILTADPVLEARICALVDLDQSETERLPARRYQRLLNRDIQVFHRVEGLPFAAALLQFLKRGTLDPDG